MYFAPKTSKPDYGPAFTYRRHLESRLKMLASPVALLWRFAVSGSDAAVTTLWTENFLSLQQQSTDPLSSGAVLTPASLTLSTIQH